MASEKPQKEGLSTEKIVGTTLRVLGLFILIINALLLSMENKNLGTIAVLLFAAISMIIIGHILSSPLGTSSLPKANKA